MYNTWIVVPVISNDADLSPLVNILSGGYVAPETYETYVPEEDKKAYKLVNEPHPYAGQTAPSYSNRIIFINKVPGYTQYDGVIHLEDFDDINIYRYWNSGLEYAIANGADSVILTNGAFTFDPFVINDAYNAYKTTEKEIINISDGAMLLVSPTSTIRADEQFQIWFGDNDLYRRADLVLEYSPSRYIKINYLINPNSVESFEDIINSDQNKYNIKWS